MKYIGKIKSCPNWSSLLMATLALSAAGATAGTQLLPNLSLFGGAAGGGTIGQLAGAAAGKFVDEALFGTSGQSKIVEGPRLTDLQVTTSTEGAPIPRVYGTTRIGGQIIWASRLIEDAEGETVSGGKSSSGSSSTTVTYSYYANFAVALCEGTISRVGRVWADGKNLDLSLYTTRLYEGSETQLPDSLISASFAPSAAPAYRGVAYIVFERMPLAPFGNRIPQLSFEVVRPVGDFHDKIKAMNIIPAAGEFAYDTVQVTREGAAGSVVAENVHSYSPGTDWDASISELKDIFPNTKNASLIVAWFGTDLRTDNCQIRPGVEDAGKVTSPYDWAVGGEGRQTAYVVSQVEGRPAYGGTPSDVSVMRAIADLKSRGMSVTFNPFILMDVPAGNGLPDPYGDTEQAAYPWRGRVSVHPAPGEPGTVDKTSSAQTQLNALIGSAQISDFSISGGSVVYNGPAEWSYRRFILHYAHLCVQAGGVDAFLLGSELRGVTRVRDNSGNFPFVDALVALASDVRAVLGSSVKLTYGADWSEYFGYQPTDGTGDVFFNLDPLWSDANIDAVAIDAYWPLSDWRDGGSHIDALAGFTSIYDDNYLRTNVKGGEYYDWYYASDQDRASQQRTSITDGAGKPWVFRAKDIWSWWSSDHFDRPGGVESAAKTAWAPESKPIWINELGCPAVQFGANQPNVFFDPKSSESFLPYFSNGTRDDYIQQRYIDVYHDFFDPQHDDFEEHQNPISSVTGKRMVDTDRLYVYTWDARPYPAFPLALDVWSDGANWERGHWLNGRATAAALKDVVRQILDEHGCPDGDTSRLSGLVRGFVVDRVMSAREALQPLELAYRFDSIEGADDIVFRSRIYAEDAGEFAPGDAVDQGLERGLFSIVRRQETELPSSTNVSHNDPLLDYRKSATQSRRLEGQSLRVASADLPVVFGESEARHISETWLHDAWATRSDLTIKLPPTALHVEPGDLVSLPHNGQTTAWHVLGVRIGEGLDIEARSLDREFLATVPADVSQGRNGEPALPPVYGAPDSFFLDLPSVADNPDAVVARIAAHSAPWPGEIMFQASVDGLAFDHFAMVTRRPTVGRTLGTLGSGVVDRIDRANTLDVELYFGTFESIDELHVFAGANTLAIEASPDNWEMLQFIDAELVGERTYRLSNLVRGIDGSAAEMVNSISPAARVILLNEAVATENIGADLIAQSRYFRFGPANRDVGDSSWVGRDFTFTAKSLRPRQPVHAKARPSVGATIVSWVRQTRVGGDNWSLNEVPVGERDERYIIRFLDAGENIVREAETLTPEYTYLDTDQLADFGTLQSSLTLQVAQISEIFGPGNWLDVSIPVRP